MRRKIAVTSTDPDVDQWELASVLRALAFKTWFKNLEAKQIDIVPGIRRKLVSFKLISCHPKWGKFFWDEDNIYG